MAFRIALETGCRLSETEIEFRHINFERKMITFVDPKGGKPYTTPLPDSLIPMLRKIKASKAKSDAQTDSKSSSTRFSNFLPKDWIKNPFLPLHQGYLCHPYGSVWSAFKAGDENGERIIPAKQFIRFTLAPLCRRFETICECGAVSAAQVVGVGLNF